MTLPYAHAVVTLWWCKGMVERKVHFMHRTWGDAQRSGLGILSPCWIRFFMYHKAGAASPLRSTDSTTVTCKHCVEALAKLTEKSIDGAGHDSSGS